MALDTDKVRRLVAQAVLGWKAHEERRGEYTHIVWDRRSTQTEREAANAAALRPRGSSLGPAIEWHEISGQRHIDPLRSMFDPIASVADAVKALEATGWAWEISRDPQVGKFTVRVYPSGGKQVATGAALQTVIVLALLKAAGVYDELEKRCQVEEPKPSTKPARKRGGKKA